MRNFCVIRAQVQWDRAFNYNNRNTLNTLVTAFVLHRSCRSGSLHSIPDMLNSIFNPSDSKQTERRMKEMVADMAKIGKSRDEQMKAVRKLKKEELDKLTKFHKALETLLRKAAEATSQALEDAFK